MQVKISGRTPAHFFFFLTFPAARPPPIYLPTLRGGGKFTYGRRDPPAPHACDFEAALLHLLAGQLDMEVELVVASADDHLAALLGEVGDAGVKLDVAIILQRLAQIDKLGLRWMNKK